MDEPRPPVIEAWLVDLRPDPVDAARPADPVLAPALVELLDADERTRAETFRRPEDRHDFVAAHGALRAILGRAVGAPPAKVELRRLACPLCREPHGRPALVGDGPAFSLSRARDWAAIAVGTGTAVGIDLERAGAATFADLRSALHRDEVAALLALPARDRALAAQRCWVRKEALLKGRGTGLGIDPETVIVGPGTGAVAPPEPIATSGPADWWLVDLPVPPTMTKADQLVLALAHRLGPDVEITVRTTSVGALLN